MPPEEELKQAMHEFVTAGFKLSEIWESLDNQVIVEEYPPYLPDFFDFLLQFDAITVRPNQPVP